jgi:hypothetical protein
MKKKEKDNSMEELRIIRERNSLKYWNKNELLLKDLKTVREEFEKNSKLADTKS